MIRLAKPADLPEILKIYEAARQFMAQNGNASQWGRAYPPRERIEADIRGGCLYVEEAEGKPAGVFAFLLGPEPNYERIDGAWRNSLPYGTIHRVASDGRVPGFFGRCMEFCKKQTANLRIDTHEENKVMRHLIEKSGFAECGIIRVEDGSPRIAYQYVGKREGAAKEKRTSD